MEKHTRSCKNRRYARAFLTEGILMKKQFLLFFTLLFFWAPCAGMIKPKWNEEHSQKEVYFVINNTSCNPVTIRVTQNAPIFSYYFTVNSFETEWKRFDLVTQLEYSSNGKHFYPIPLPNNRPRYLITFRNHIFSLLCCCQIPVHNYEAVIIEKYE
jgi:hypothetical protein